MTNSPARASLPHADSAKKGPHEEAEIFDLLNRVGTAVAAEIDLERAVQVVTDAATEASHAAFGAFFYNVIDEKGEAYTLYTLSGVSRDAFAGFPMPRNTKVFGPTFGGEGIVRSADITKDPRYGKNPPHNGMPKGHLPVRSYLAVSVFSRSGEVLGGLFFGHPEVGVFDDRAERIVAAIALQAGIAIDKARLFRAAQDEIERRKGVELRLRESEQTLEAKVTERTAQLILEVSHREKALEDLHRAQDQLAQAQKMEGIGHLTGGVAHDFNNLLAIIMGNLETMQRIMKAPSLDVERLKRSAENAMQGAKRAAALTQRLLAFARQQPLDPKAVDVNKLVSGMSDLLRRSLGERVAIETALADDLWNAHVDQNNLEIAIVNLAVNARDAMPDGGKLVIETANALIGNDSAGGEAEPLPGQYVVITITDTGFGMSRDVARRVFEPFFTTKDIGHGTGLGLSQVYGFVKQSGGQISIDSEIGRGTTVKIYLPRPPVSEDHIAASEPAMLVRRGNVSETILVVEDDPDVRRNTNEMLRELGYTTVEADSGAAALDLLRTHPEIKLLFSDIGLPGGMNGPQLAEKARAMNCGLKILFTSGYARDAIVHDGRLDPGVQLLTKPFTYSALASKLRELLDTPARSDRILLVEDEVLIQLLALDQLEELGFKAEAVASATEAMNALKLFNGDVIAAIIDLGLPDRRGDVLVSEIRALYPTLPIVLASGYDERMVRSKLKTHDRIAFLAKPYQTRDLQVVLSSLDVSTTENSRA